MPAQQTSTGLCTLFLPLLEEDMVTEGGELNVSYDPLLKAAVQTRLVKHLRKYSAGGGWFGMVTEICPTTFRTHIHFAFQAGLTPSGNVKKVSCNAVRTLLSEPDVNMYKSIVIDLKFPIKCLEGKKSVVNYLKKGNVITKDEWNESGADHPQHGVGGAVDFIQEGSIRLPTPGAQGSRNDIDAVRDVILGLHESLPKPDNYRALIAHPMYAEFAGVVAKYPGFCKELISNRFPEEKEIIKDFRDWQQELDDVLKEECEDNRRIWWIYDPRGAAGKSTMVKHLIYNRNAITLSGKANDIFYAYQGQRIAIFDIPRSHEGDFINYGAMEKIKDGVFFVAKYNSMAYVRDYNAHVVVFANCLPDETKFTPDRLEIVHLSEPTINDNLGQGFGDYPGGN